MKKLSAILFLILPAFALAGANTPELAVKNYYEIPALFDQILAKHTENEIIRKEFKSSLNDIVAGNLFESWSRFIDSTSTRSTFYNEAFSRMSPTTPYKLLNITLNGNSAVAKTKINITETYSESQNLGSVEDLFEKYNIKNIKLTELKEKEKNHPALEIIEYQVTSNVIETLELTRINKSWKVEKVTKNILDSKLKAIMP